jgi:hypothetical protein
MLMELTKMVISALFSDKFGNKFLGEICLIKQLEYKGVSFDIKTKKYFLNVYFDYKIRSSI